MCGLGRWGRLVKGVPRAFVCSHCCSPQTRVKMSLARIGHAVSQETRNKISKAKIGHPCYEKMRGRHPSEETRRKLSIAAKGRKASEATKEKIRNSRLGRELSDETKRKLSIAHKGRKTTLAMISALVRRNKTPISEERRERLRSSHLGQKPSLKARMVISKRSRERWQDAKYKERMLDLMQSPESREKASKSLMGHKTSLETREKISKSLRGHIVTPETLYKIHAALNKSLHIRPNKSEKKLFNILDKLYPTQWVFVGDWSMTLAGKNPDFVNCNGKKIIIELYGDYWHRNDNPAERIKIFSNYGYDTLIIWESELCDENKVSEKIKEFAGGH